MKSSAEALCETGLILYEAGFSDYCKLGSTLGLGGQGVCCFTRFLLRDIKQGGEMEG